MRTSNYLESRRIGLFVRNFAILSSLILLGYILPVFAGIPVEIPPNWQRIGPYGGRVIDIEFAVSNSDIIYVLFENGNTSLFRSNDGGRTWNNMIIPFDPDLPLLPNDLAISRQNQDFLVFVDYAYVYISKDGGLTWAVNDSQMYFFNRIIFDPTDDSILYTWSFGDKIWKSIDSGLTWEEQGYCYVFGIDIDRTDNQHLIAACSVKGMYVSYDGAASWSVLAFADQTVDFALFGRDEGVIYAVVGDELWVSHNSGIDWELSYSWIDRGPSDMTIVFNPVETIYVAIGGIFLGDQIFDHVGIFRSTDEGITWENITAGRSKIYYLTLSVNPENADHVIVASQFSGIQSTYDAGQTWQLPDSSFPGMWINSVALSPHRSGLILAASHGDGQVLRTTDFGITWNYTNFQKDEYLSYLPAKIVFSPTNPDRVFLSNDGGFARSNDAGINWESIKIQDFWNDSLAASPVNDELVIVGGYPGQIARSTNAGDTWSIVYTALDTTETVVDVEFKPMNPTTVYALKENWSSQVITLLKSTDSGATWQEVSTLPTIAASDLAISYTEPEIIYECSGQKIMRSDNQGITWRILPFPEWQPVDKMAVSFRHFSWIWVIDGFKLSTDFGETWRVIERPANGPDTEILVGNDANPGIFFGTNDGIWTYPDGVPPRLMMAGVTTQIEKGQNLIHFMTWPADLEGSSNIQKISVLYDGIDTGLTLFDDGTHGDANMHDGIFELIISVSSLESEVIIPWSLVAVDQWGFQSEIWPKITVE